MRFAYADPPYLDQCSQYGHRHDPPYGCWDELRTHGLLIEHLIFNYPDGWALSASSPSLKYLLAACPEDVRIAAWVKPFASFKPNVGEAYTWEPIIIRGGRPRGREQPTVRDHISAGITLQRGLAGTKPEAFCRWLFEFLNLRAGDEFIDLFPGTGAVTRAWDKWRSQLRLIV